MEPGQPTRSGQGAAIIAIVMRQIGVHGPPDV